jgi:hypothetical protein
VKIRYQADNDLRGAIVRGTIRREAEIDFRSGHAACLQGVPDSEVLAMAARDGRILVSHDFQTMPVLFRQFTESQPSPGVLLISQDLPVSRAIESLLFIWKVTAPEEWHNRLCLIPNLVTVAMGPSR